MKANSAFYDSNNFRSIGGNFDLSLLYLFSKCGAWLPWLCRVGEHACGGRKQGVSSMRESIAYPSFFIYTDWKRSKMK